MNDCEILRNEINIQWYPGHMTKAMRMMEENIKNVDAVCEILDARIPASSHNPALDDIISAKPRLIILNRVDQADPELTKKWSTHFKSLGWGVLETDCKSGKGTQQFANAVKALLHEKIQSYVEKGQIGRALRVMITGIPNVGKSSFINRVAGRKAAEASDRPGVTRAKQWVKIGGGLELMDTPGVLWPKFESQSIGENLAFTGAVKDDILDRTALAANLLLRLKEMAPKAIELRYKVLPKPEDTGYELLEALARKRGFLISGGEYDIDRMAAVLLDEFRGGKLGRITLEAPAD